MKIYWLHQWRVKKYVCVHWEGVGHTRCPVIFFIILFPSINKISYFHILFICHITWFFFFISLLSFLEHLIFCKGFLRLLAAYKRVQSKINVCSFNVRGINSDIEKDNLVSDLIKYKADVTCLQETKLANGVDVNIRGQRLLCFKSDSRHYGSGFLLSKLWSDKIHCTWKVTDKICVLQLKINEIYKNNEITKLVTLKYPPINQWTVTLYHKEVNLEAAL